MREVLPQSTPRYLSSSASALMFRSIPVSTSLDCKRRLFCCQSEFVSAVESSIWVLYILVACAQTLVTAVLLGGAALLALLASKRGGGKRQGRSPRPKASSGASEGTAEVDEERRKASLRQKRLAKQRCRLHSTLTVITAGSAELDLADMNVQV